MIKVVIVVLEGGVYIEVIKIFDIVKFLKKYFFIGKVYSLEYVVDLVNVGIKF